MASDRERWDERYRAALADGGGERPPASLLQRHTALLEAQPRGPALDVAAGLGRNARHLAGLGFDVEAVDVSAVAVEHLGRIGVRARRLDLSSDPLPRGPYQVVVCTFYLERRLFGPIAEALAPGGLLFFETFLPDPDATYGPQGHDRVLEPGELARAFAGLEVLLDEEGPVDLESRATARLVARRQQPT